MPEEKFDHLNEDGLLHFWTRLKAIFAGKVDKADGKGLSSNDFTDEYKQKVDQAGVSDFTGNYSDLFGLPTFDGHELKGALTHTMLGIALKSELPDSLSNLLNDVGFQNANQVLNAIENALASFEAGFLKYKGEVATFADLPSGYSDINAGWLWHVEADHTAWFWLAGEWNKLDFDMDMSSYVKLTDLVPITNSEIDAILAQ